MKKSKPSLENFSEKEIKTTSANKLKGGRVSVPIVELTVFG